MATPVRERQATTIVFDNQPRDPWRQYNDEANEKERREQQRWQSLTSQERYQELLARADQESALSVAPDLESDRLEDGEWLILHLIDLAVRAGVSPEIIQQYREQKDRLTMANKYVLLGRQVTALERERQKLRDRLSEDSRT